MSQPPSHNRRIIELRKHPRIFTPSGALFSLKRLISPAQFEEHTEGEGTLIELSLGGCRLLSDIPLEIGERYNLILQVTKESCRIRLYRSPISRGMSLNGTILSCKSPRKAAPSLLRQPSCDGHRRVPTGSSLPPCNQSMNRTTAASTRMGQLSLVTCR